MPNTESAKKRVRQGAKLNARNNWRKRRVKGQVTEFLKAMHDKNVASAETELRKMTAILDKVADTGTIHKNTAARRKSRMAKRLNALRKGA